MHTRTNGSIITPHTKNDTLAMIMVNLIGSRTRNDLDGKESDGGVGKCEEDVILDDMVVGVRDSLKVLVVVINDLISFVDAV